MNTRWMWTGEVLKPHFGDLEIMEEVKPGIYTLDQISSGFSSEIVMRPICQKFEFPYKIYDLGISEQIEHVKATWDCLGKELPAKNLGVLFHGTKGTGKTIAAKVLCNSLDIPVICIPQNYPGLELFLGYLNFDCAILIDEMEKTFPEGDSDQVILRILDGIYQGNTKKLFVMTTNTLNINNNLLGRPGRIRYFRKFENLEMGMVQEYIKDNLKNPELESELMEIIDSLQISTIDILKSLVEEMNIHGHIKESDLDFLNIPRQKYLFAHTDMFGIIGLEDETFVELAKIVKLERDSDLFAFKDGGWRSDPESVVWLGKYFSDCIDEPHVLDSKSDPKCLLKKSNEEVKYWFNDYLDLDLKYLECNQKHFKKGGFVYIYGDQYVILEDMDKNNLIKVKPSDPRNSHGEFHIKIIELKNTSIYKN